MSIPFNHFWLGVQLPSVLNIKLLYSALNSFNTWKHDLEITYQQVFQCQLIVHPQEHKRYNKTYGENNERHLSTIRWFLLKGLAMKMLQLSTCFPIIASQTNTSSTPYQHIFWTTIDHHHSEWHLFFNWDLLPVRLNRHYEAWSYKKINQRK